MSGLQLLLSLLLSLVVLVGTIWTSYHSSNALPMMNLYHVKQNYDWHNTGEVTF